MALLIETTLGDLVIDLDVEGSPEICKNVLKLAKARHYTSTLIYNIQANRFCQLGDAQGDGTGGACIYGLIECHGSSKSILQSQHRFLKSHMGRPLTEEECRQKGRVVATEMNGIPDTIGSQLLITTCEGQDMALDGFSSMENTATGDDTGKRQIFRSVGVVTEDKNNVLDQIGATYCDADGRPYADIRVKRALIIDDPFDDPPGMDRLLEERGVIMAEDDRVTASPDYERPPEENVEIRIQADQVDPLTGEDDLEKVREQEEGLLKREDKSRAVVLEMLGDLPSAEATAPENVLFVCKLNPVTEDEDLELIFSRFDEKVKAEIIRDQDTGSSLQYAFIEFTTKEQAAEAYFKMDNALVDDRRIKVDFSQSVAKVWNKYTQRARKPSGAKSNQLMPRDPFGENRNKPEAQNYRGSYGNNHQRKNPHHNDGRGHGRQQERLHNKSLRDDYRRHRHDRRLPNSQEEHVRPEIQSNSGNVGRKHNEGHLDQASGYGRRHKGKDERRPGDNDRSKRRYDSDERSNDSNDSSHDKRHRRHHRSRSRSQERRDRQRRKHHKKSSRHHKNSREGTHHPRRRSYEDDDSNSNSSHQRHRRRDEDSDGKNREKDRDRERRHRKEKHDNGRNNDRSGHRRGYSEEASSGDRNRYREKTHGDDEAARYHAHRHKSKRHRNHDESDDERHRKQDDKRSHDESRRRHRDRHNEEFHHSKRRREN